MKARLVTLAAAAIFACTGSACAETPEEAVMFMAFGVRDKEAVDKISFVKTSDVPLTLQFMAALGGMAPRSIMAMTVTKEDDCRYQVDMKPAEDAQNPMPQGKFRFDLTNLKAVTFKGPGRAQLEGATLQCVESANTCDSFAQKAKDGLWEVHFGPAASGKGAEVMEAHQQALNAVVEDFKANICKSQ